MSFIILTLLHICTLHAWVSTVYLHGSPTSGPRTSTSCQISGDISLEIKCLINVMHLNNHQTIPLPSRSVEKLSSTKLVPGAKMGNLQKFPATDFSYKVSD